MVNYLFLYSGGGMPQTDEEKAQIMQAWENWFKELGDALVDGGNPFTGNAKTVAADKTVTTAMTSGSGYSVVKADSMEAALEMAKTCPVLLGGAEITVFETFNVM